MNLERFHEFWKLNSLYPEPYDEILVKSVKIAERHRLLTAFNQEKFEHEFERYTKQSIDYLKSKFNAKIIVMIDDVDRLENINDPKNIIRHAKGLARKLGYAPVIISAREETSSVLSDVDSYAHKISIIPPNFGEVLIARRNIFNNNYKLSDELRNHYNIDEYELRDFINLVVSSILDENVYANLIEFHYDLDILLDIVRSIMKSPFITRDYAKKLVNKEEKIPWHVILDSMQRYKYKNFYEENSFFLNIFDNDLCPSSKLNSLIRLRILQVLRYRYRGFNQEISLNQIYDDMQQLGYDKKDVNVAMKALARQRIIVTKQGFNEFFPYLPEIIPQRAIVFYLDKLIFNCRYIQNALSATHIDFDLPMDIIEIDSPFVGDKLKEVDLLIKNFLKFLKDAEILEAKQIKNQELLKLITRDREIAKKFKYKLMNEISSMKAPGRNVSLE